MSEQPAAAPPAPETLRAERVVEEVKETSTSEKKAIAIDQKLLMSEVQLLLAEKRTSFALLRTGVTVSLIPVSIWTVLVTTSRLWNPFDVMWLLAPVMIVAVALFGLGNYLVVHALIHLRHCDRTLAGLRRTDTLLEELLYRETSVGSVLGRLRWRHG